MIGGFFRFALVLFRRTFITDHCTSLAAAISFYAILSFFPFVLLAVALLSHFVSSSETALQDVINFITQNLPVSAASAVEIVSSTVKSKTIYGIVGVVGLLWGSMSIFSVMEYAMNRIWRTREERGIWRARLVALICIPFMLVFVLMSVALTGLIAMAKEGVIPILNISLVSIPIVGRLISLLVPLVVSIFLFTWVYYLLPSRWNHFRCAVYGALLAGALWEVAKLLFDYYVRNFAQLLTIYGSFTSIAILLLWVYYSAFVVLLGAEFGSLLQEIRERKLASLGGLSPAEEQII